MKGIIAAAMALLSVTLAGCSDASSVLHGSVTHRGRSVTSGSVIVLNDDGRAHSGVIQPDGTYRVERVGRGTVRIGVLSPDPARARSIVKSEGEIPKSKSKSKSGTGNDRSGWFPLPRDIGDPQKSGITCSVESADMRFDIVIP